MAGTMRSMLGEDNVEVVVFTVIKMATVTVVLVAESLLDSVKMVYQNCVLVQLIYMHISKDQVVVYLHAIMLVNL